MDEKRCAKGTGLPLAHPSPSRELRSDFFFGLVKGKNLTGNHGFYMFLLSNLRVSG
jgi:hypothetical protein